MKNWIRVLPALLLCAILLTVCAYAEEMEMWSGEVAVADGLTDADRFEDYVSGLFGLEIPKPARRMRSSGVTLTGDLKAFYDFLKECIQEVAAGARTSTEFTLDMGFTLEEEDLGRLHSALVADCPYDLYWYDKTQGFGLSSDGLQTTFSFAVNAEYAAGVFEVDPSKINRANAAVANAEAILSSHASSSDYDRLKGYKDAICGLVSYNTPAAEDPDNADSNAWQLIWVFDGDDSTNVVCEGYSKAFQYLCDRTDFDGSVNCASVTGVMGGGTGSGDHMWNLVRMPNGETYLADITNCDGDSVGADDLLFLAGYTSGSVDAGYEFRCDHGDGSYTDVSYIYDSYTLKLYSTEALTVAELGYLESVAAHTVASGQCGDNLTWTLDDEDTLTITGTGEMTSNPVGEATWIRKVLITDGATSICAGAFAGCTSLVEVSIPDSVLSIGDQAFYNCTEIESIILPQNLQSVGNEAFLGCDKLTGISLPDGLSAIGSTPFSNNTVVYANRDSQAAMAVSHSP